MVDTKENNTRSGRGQGCFTDRHIGPRVDDIDAMLKVVGCKDLSDLSDQAVPASIRQKRENSLDGIACQGSEQAALSYLEQLADKNEVHRSYLGMGYHGTVTPPVILRNILENPGWYTQYTPYQPEISQGRLEALLHYQTLIAELAGLPVANASLLDEGTAAAEAMSMSYGLHAKRHKTGDTFFVSAECHPQTIAVVQTRAAALGFTVVVGNHEDCEFNECTFGALLQYPASCGRIYDYKEFVERAHKHDVIVTVAADLMALVLLTPPGEFGADIAVGNTQRFGVPLGYGGPHAAYFATQDKYKRAVPGRLVGISRDSNGNPAYRLSLQTREQHIRREKATSNICTAQVLLAIMAGMYGIYHGPKGLKSIA
ncbi:glycine dehydrogenase (aminomethyl-transferring), partial [Oligoflexia bacterium]|nr:glycine dehydrogenase (aminomethyl-transferring) [Oligoflexia bacterium]